MNLKEATEAITNATSRMGPLRVEDVAEALANDHRTLQQNVMDFCLIFIEKMAENHITGRTDLRNEAAADVANEIVESVFTNGQRPLLPFV